MKRGGGSIKVGTTGTISSLMTRELETIKSAPQTQVCSRNKPRTVPSVPCGAPTPKRLQSRKSLDDASSSGSRNVYRSPEISRKMKTYNGRSQKMPMLGSAHIPLDGTPRRETTIKKGSKVVEIVDIKCGNSERAWASPIANRLKKLGFSKLSETIA